MKDCYYDYEIGYCVNVSFDGKPFYVRPSKVDVDWITMQKNYKPEKGIYYLFNTGILVYIGISQKNVYGRILSHLKDKQFDSYFIFTCIDNEGNLNKKLIDWSIKSEKILIKHFKPMYNSLNNFALKQSQCRLV